MMESGAVPGKVAKRVSIPVPFLKAAFLFFAAGLVFQDLILPSSGLDPSWKLATQYGLLENIDFGRYLIIAYGPLSALTSRLFHPSTWHLTVLFELLCVVLALWPIVDRHWNRRFILVLLVCLLVNRIFYTNDGVVFAAVFSTFLLALLGRRAASLLGAAVIGVLALSKTSFFFAAAPLFLLADLFGGMKKRALPLQTLTLFVTMAAAFVISGQNLESLPLYLRNGYEISKYYSTAMSLPSGPAGAVMGTAFLTCTLGLTLLLVVRARQMPAAPTPNERQVLPVAALGLIWLALIMYKASFVRFDVYHYYTGWNALLFILPVALLTTWRLTNAPSRVERLDSGLILVAVAIFLVTMDLPASWKQGSAAENLARFTSERIAEKVGNVTSLLDWLRPGKSHEFEEGRLAALARIARRVPIGRETIDVYPYDIGNVIAAGLNYQPRPTMQSYLAYSPYLQNLDLAHWRGPHAPDHILFVLADIDGRLPTLALGPSVVELLSRYDAVEAVGRQIHLRKRAVPHPVTADQGASRPLALDEWIPVPGAPAKIVLARIKLQQTLLGSALAFVGTPPVLGIETQHASGEVRVYRFIAPMAEIGFAISPDLVPLLGAPGSGTRALLPGLRELEPVTAFRIRGAPGAARAFGAGEVSFSVVDIEDR